MDDLKLIDKTEKELQKQVKRVKLFSDIHLKKPQINEQLIFSVIRQKPLHVSGVSLAYYQEVHRIGYSSWYLLFFLDECLLSWLGWHCQPSQDNRI